MMQSIGILEIQGYVPAFAALDVMLKAADVHLVTWEKKLGGWLVTIVISGEVSAVKAAIEAAKKNPLRRIAASAVIANPHPEILKQIEISQQKYPNLMEESYHDGSIGND